MKIIKKEDSNYPKSLLNIPNSPQMLYVEGNEELLNTQAIAIVGTRKPTEYGKKVAKEFAQKLSENNICIISGLAEGIDTYAHFGAKSERGKTIAVLGSGFNNIYPKQNLQLYNEILEEGGCIISEYEPKEEAKSENFPMRNRIISGLAMGVLIVEARYRSGSAITARYANMQRKEVFCVPRDIDKKTGYLPNEFIKNGAHLVMSYEDILEYFPKPKENANIAEEYVEIYQYIGDIPISVDEICRLTNLSIAGVNERLMLMEIEGLIKNVPGGYIKI